MVKKPNISKELKIKACQDYRLGNGSFESIAKDIGCHYSSVRNWYKAYIFHGPSIFDISNRNNSYSKEFKNSIIQIYLSGKSSLADIGAKYNISTSLVRDWIKRYNNGIELKDYDPIGDVYTMKSRKTTYEERLEIVKWVIENNMNYKAAADKYAIKYALVYKWTRSYLKIGAESLEYKKRGPKDKNVVDESTLTELEKLKIELEREKTLRKRAEFENEVLKKKEEFEKKNRSRK